MSIETLPSIKAVGRMLRAAGKRVGDGDEHELAALLSLRDKLDEAILVAVQAQRENGKSWTDIGRGAGISRQRAQKRWNAGP